MDYGLLPTGPSAKPLSQILTDLDSAMQGIVGKAAATNPDGTIPSASIAGQIIVMMADPVSYFWQLWQGTVSGFDPASAVGVPLDQIASLTGTIREAGSFATSEQWCTGTPGTILPPGRVVTVSTLDFLGNRFDSEGPSSYTIASVPAWAGATSYLAGQVVTNASKCYLCTAGGTSAGSGGPTGSTYGTPITDMGVTWQYLGAGTGAVLVPFEAEILGDQMPLAYEITTIGTPVSGWSGTANPLDAVPGADQETDTAFRLRRDEEISALGNSTVDAIRARVLQVNQNSTDPSHTPPVSVNVLFNDSDVIDANGLPPHSVEVIALGGTPQDIAQEIWNCVDGGTNTHGGAPYTVMDSEGNPQTVYYTIPTEVPIYVVATVYYDAAKWPVSSPSAAVIQAALSALLTYGQGYAVSVSVRATPLAAAILDEPSATDASGNAVVPAPPGSTPAPGLLDVTPMYIGTAPSPVTSTPVTIGVRQVAQFESINITLTATAETP